MNEYFGIFYKHEAEVITRKETGGYSRQMTETVLTSVKCDIQPYRGDLAMKEYGAVIECDKKMFFDNCPEIQENNFIRFENILYRIVRADRRSAGGVAYLRRET